MRFAGAESYREGTPATRIVMCRAMTRCGGGVGEHVIGLHSVALEVLKPQTLLSRLIVGMS
jgi:hypothetical protein